MEPNKPDRTATTRRRARWVAEPVPQPRLAGPGALDQHAPGGMNRPQDLARREAPWGAPTDREPRQRVPAYAVYDEGEEITVEFELPGVPAEDIEINGFRDRIRIEAERGLESSERQGIAGATGPTRFQLEAPLQLEVEPTEAVARLEDGLLSVVLPKANPNQGIASIPVQD